MPVELTVDQQVLQAVGRALKSEEDGRALKRELSKNLKTAIEPMKGQARSNLLGIASAGFSRGQPLRQSVLSQMKTQVRFSGRSTGARLAVSRKGMPRGFRNAPKALNTPKGWRHRAFGRNAWIQQYGIPAEWFDRATRAGRDRSRELVVAALADMVKRVASKSKR